jgi:hypothetical protein
MARQKSPKKPKSSPVSPNPSLALSSLHLRLQALEEEHQWLLKQINRKRNELKNFLDQVRSMATQMFHRGEPLHRKLMDLDREIHTLFDEVLTTRKLGKQTKQKVLNIYENLQFMGAISPKLDEEDEELDDIFEEEEDNNYTSQETEDFFRGNRDQSTPEGEKRSSESREIRRTFLRLAEVFHPDKVTDQETQKRHNEIMKEVNRAYKEGDIARLLEIERQHHLGESLSLDDASESDLERQCKRRESDNELLKKQYENLKEELRLVRNTPEGEMVKDCRACVKEGIDPIKEMLKAMEIQVQTVENIRDFVRDFRNQKISIKEFLQGPTSMTPEHSQDMEDILQELIEQLNLTR